MASNQSGGWAGSQVWPKGSVEGGAMGNAQVSLGPAAGPEEAGDILLAASYVRAVVVYDAKQTHSQVPALLCCVST